MSVNKVILLGNVGRDPDVRYTGPGQAIAEFTLATTERAHTNAAGVQVPERTEWHRIVMNGQNALFAERYIRKGTKLYIEGKILSISSAAAPPAAASNCHAANTFF